MSVLAAWLAHPIEFRFWLWVLAAFLIGATVLAALRVRDDRAAGRSPDPFTVFLVSAPKALGVLALLLSAFAFVLEVDVTAVNLSWWQTPNEEDWLPRIGRLLTAGAAIAAAGFLASWILAAFLPDRKEPR